MNIKKIVFEFKKKTFIKSLINDMKGEVYIVGGYVRDLLLNKNNKDVDLLIRLIEFNDLINCLKKYGDVNLVGKSFGVIKFNSYEDNLEYDISLPRTEKKVSDGHKGFNIFFNKNLKIEKDLERRDIRINAIAINLNNGDIVDPFGGQEDLKNGKIRIVNKNTFFDDPLRSLRIIGFASRFGFSIEFHTFNEIIGNAERIKEISPERILIEFDKIAKKGDALYAIDLLRETRLFEQIFNNIIDINRELPWNKIKHIGEFIWMIGKDAVDNISFFYKEILKGDVETANFIKAIDMAFRLQSDKDGKNRNIVFAMNKISPMSLESDVLPDIIKKNIDELKSDKYPLTLKELDINGFDLLKLGYEGERVGSRLRNLLVHVYHDRVKNNKNDLIKFLENNE